FFILSSFYQLILVFQRSNSAGTRRLGHLCPGCTGALWDVLGFRAHQDGKLILVAKMLCVN
ncbi:MAG: hypothetical protein NT042_10415, partial [Sulfuritalea sp.]|nr:hypothetical protein [Sulfuritalea sp.]